MSKNIIIQEGGIGKQMTVDKLRTDLVGGGNCLWVPEDTAQLGTKYITEDGTYRASADGLYGYSEVTVSGIGTVTGKDPDGSGDDAEATVDPGTGEIVITKLPSSIRVVTPPTTIRYVDGATIDFAGMVVKAYLKSGGLWTDASHPNGIIPINELTLPVTTAHFDESGGQSEWSDGQGVNAFLYSYTKHRDMDWEDKEFAVYADISKAIGTQNGQTVYFRGNGPGQFFATVYNNKLYAKSISGVTLPLNGTSYDPSKKQYKFYGGWGSNAYAGDNVWMEWAIGNENNYINVPRSTANPVNSGELQPTTTKQTIPVQFQTSQKTLETSFTIDVYKL